MLAKSRFQFKSGAALILTALLLILSGCGDGSADSGNTTGTDTGTCTGTDTGTDTGIDPGADTGTDTGTGGGTSQNTATILCFGDAQTFATNHSLTPDQYWPNQAQLQATADGYSVNMLNLGHGGWTTADLLGILQSRLKKYAPNIVVFYAGMNDPGKKLTGANTQSDIQSVIDMALANKVAYVLIVNTNYLNYSSGGDNALTGKYYAVNQTLRTYQLAAVNYGITKYGASKVGYCDLFAYQKNLILAKTWTQGHWQDSQVADMNEHMNAPAEKSTAADIWSLLKAVPGLMAPYTTQ